jgi:tight adherence protein C
MDLARIVLLGAAAALFVGVLVVVATVASASFGRAGVARGLQAIDKVYGARRARPREEQSDRSFAPVANRMTQIGRAATPPRALAMVRRWLDLAGNPPYWTVDRVFEIKGLGLLVVGGLGVILGLLFGGGVGALIGGLAGAGIGFYIPDVVIYELAERRQHKLRQTLPDILDMLTVSVEAGLGFDAALAQITRYGRGPLAGEFARVLQEMQIGRSRVDALRALGLRTKVQELKSFCAIVVQATELGIPIANVLREQAKEMRIARRQRAEELAQKVPVKILFPLVFCLFPALFIVVLGPGVIRILDQFFP